MLPKDRGWSRIHRPTTLYAAAAAAKSLQSCLTLCDPRDGSPPGSPVPGILQARTLEWVAISFSNAWKWKVKLKSLSRVRFFWPHALQPTRLLHPWDFPGKSTGVGCHCLLQASTYRWLIIWVNHDCFHFLSSVGSYMTRKEGRWKRRPQRSEGTGENTEFFPGQWE